RVAAARRGPLGEHGRRAGARYDGGQTFEDTGRHLAGRLVVSHDPESMVWRQAEEFEHLVEHLAMLVRDADHGLEARRRYGEGAHHGGHLDRFGARAEHTEDARTVEHPVPQDVALCRRRDAMSNAWRRLRDR